MAGFWERMKAEFVQEVPEEIAFCEFNCRKEQCTEADWQTCPLRLAMAAKANVRPEISVRASSHGRRELTHGSGQYGSRVA